MADADMIITGGVRRRFLRWKTFVGLALGAAMAFYVVRHGLYEVSGAAVLTAPLDRVVAPIQGTVLGAAAGEVVPALRPVVQVHGLLPDERERFRIEREIVSAATVAALAAREIAEIDALAAGVEESEERWRASLLVVLDAEAAEIEAQIAAREAQYEVRRAERRFAEEMAMRGLWAEPRVAAARATEIAAAREIDVLRARSLRLAAERRLAEQGGRVREGSQDVPTGRLFRQQLVLRRIEAVRRMDEAREHEAILRLQAAVEEQQAAIRRQWSAMRDEPVLVWQRHVPDGALVQPGTTIADVVSCRTLFVLAAVPERLYDLIDIGTAADVVVRGFRPMMARVTAKYGASARFAEEGVLAAALIRPFGATMTIRLDFVADTDVAGFRLSDPPSCGIGRRVEVYFPREIQGLVALWDNAVAMVGGIARGIVGVFE